VGVEAGEEHQQKALPTISLGATKKNPKAKLLQGSLRGYPSDASQNGDEDVDGGSLPPILGVTGSGASTKLPAYAKNAQQLKTSKKKAKKLRGNEAAAPSANLSVAGKNKSSNHFGFSNGAGAAAAMPGRAPPYAAPQGYAAAPKYKKKAY